MTTRVVPGTRAPGVGPWIGLGVALALGALGMLVPAVTGWHVHVNYFPPLHAIWDPRVGWGTIPSLLAAGLAAWQAVTLAQRLSWGRLLLASYAAGLVWMLSLALVDGTKGIGGILDTRYEYLPTARTLRTWGEIHHALVTWVARIPFDGRPDNLPDANWPPHVAGHPPGATLFFVALARLGLGSALAAGLVVTLVAATTALAVMVALRTLGAEDVARRAAPFLVLGPAAVWQCVSGDAMFAATAAWGLACLAVAATRRSVAWSLLAGLVLGWTVMLSYGLLLLGLLALAVLVVARSWKPLPWAVLGALVPVGVFAVLGFHYWEALPALHDRYWAGVARNRPESYWVWGDFSALAFSAGPLAGAGLAAMRRPDLLSAAHVRVVRWLSGATVATLLAADASLMSKAEVERIWLPFVPWLLVSCALLPERWRRRGLVVQLVLALVIQHLLDTGW